VAGTDHPVVRALVAKLSAAREMPPLIAFGHSPEAGVRIGNVYTNGGSVSFDVEAPAGVNEHPLKRTALKLKVPGTHNALNAAAAIAVGRGIGLPAETILSALASFEGVDRRFTPTGSWNGVAIFDDYAHHPAEIEATLSAARGAAKGNVIAIVQPHRFSRLQSLFEGFCRCFRDADMVLVAPVYSAGESPNGYDSDRLAEGIRRAGHARVYSLAGEEALAPTVAALARPGDLVIGLGAGSISDWARALPEKLSAFSLAGAAE
jgi:UDP-N-acetylmuramate--alanine ligase